MNVRHFSSSQLSESFFRATNANKKSTRILAFDPNNSRMIVSAHGYILVPLIYCIMMPLKQCHKPHVCWRLFVLHPSDQLSQHLTGRKQIKEIKTIQFLAITVHICKTSAGSLWFMTFNHQGMRQCIRVWWFCFCRVNLKPFVFVYALYLLEREHSLCFVPSARSSDSFVLAELWNCQSWLFSATDEQL